jgi:hypothetical protein
VTYGEDLVDRRDRERSLARWGERVRPAIVLLAPVIGLLPAAWKERLHERHGVDARAATEASLWVEWLVVVLGVALLSIFGLAEAMTGMAHVPLAWFAIPAAVAGIDAMMRCGSLLEETTSLPGFYEWIVRRGPGLRRP